MQPQEVNQTAASSAVVELQAVVGDQESEFQQLLSDRRRAAQSMHQLSDSADVSDEAMDDLRWTVDSVRTELLEARQILRGAVDRVSGAAALFRQFG